MSAKVYKIFLASSAELLSDRREFSDLINYLNNENIRLNRGAQFQQVKWEWVDESVGDLRKQDDYNQLLQTCDLFVMLYWTKVGKYSEEEFDLAYERLKGKRRLFVYKKTAVPPHTPSDHDRQSLTAFEQKLLANPEHFVSQYEIAEELKFKTQTELTRLFDDKVFTYAEMPMAKCLSAGQPAVPNGFIGREDELRTIRQRMDEGGTLMLINSEGGMGKTSIAAKYWTEHLYRYKHNAWLFCENGIVEEMKKLAPQLNLDLAQIPEKDHVEALRTALQNTPGECLLVLDNANNDKDIKAFRQTFAGLHWHVLITSRCQHVLDRKQELPITHLPPPLAKDLFVSYYREETADFETLLDRLLLAIGYNTLLIELFAKNMAELAALGETLADLLQRLETEGLFLRERSFEVQTPYTTHVHKEAATTDDIIEALYDLTKLDETDRYRLVNLALLPAESHLLTLLIDLFAPDDKFAFRNQLANLAQKGWLTTDTQSYRLSPVVQKIVLAKNKETLWDDGKELVNRLNHLLETDGFFTKNIALRQAQPFVQVGLSVVNFLTTNTEELGSLYRSLSDYFRSVGLPNQAIQCALQYSQLSESRNDTVNIAISYERLGSNYQAQNKLTEAFAYFKKLVDVSKEFYQIKSQLEKSKELMAISYSKLCEIYQIEGEFKQATVCAKKAIMFTKKLHLNNPHLERYENLLTNLYGRFGEIYHAQGQLEKAFFYFNKSKKINQKLYKNNPNSELIKNLLSISYYKIGQIYQMQDRFEQAIIYYKKDLQLTEELYQTNSYSESHKNNLASSYFTIGTMYYQQELFDLAITNFNKGNVLVNELYQNNPNSIEIRKNLANSYSMTGEINQLQGNVEQALINLEKCRGIYEEFYLINPNSVEIIYELANSYYRLGLVHQDMNKQFHVATHYYQKALPMLEGLVIVTPVTQYLRLLEQVKNKLQTE